MSRRASFLSGTHSQLTEENNQTEMFDGVAPEAIPSSISSFHHLHHFSHRRGTQSSSNNNSAAASAASSVRRGRLANEPNSYSLSRTHTGGSVSRSHSVDSRAHFHFFNPQDIEQAHGASTLIDSDSNISIDYDTNWDVANNQYNDAEDDMDSRRRYSLSTTISAQDYGSIDRPHSRNNTSSSSPSTSYNTYRDRIPSDVSNRPLLEDEELSEHDLDDGSLNSENGDSSSDNNNNGNSNNNSNNTAYEIKADSYDHYFPNYKPNIHFQRFYIAEEDLVLGIAGYKTSKLFVLIYYFLCIITFGMFYLILRWFPRLKFAIYGIKTPLAKAEWVVIETEFGQLDIIDVQREWYNRHLSTIMNIPHFEQVLNSEGHDTEYQFNNQSLNPIIPILISFEYRYLKFYFTPIEDIFKTNTNWVDINWLNNVKHGLNKETYEDRLIVFNSNSLNLKEKSVKELLIDEVLHPFYIFQIFSIILWAFDQYYYYAGCIFLISIVSILNTLIETKDTMKRLKNLSRFQCTVRVWRNGFWKETDSSDLIPGDIYEVSDPSLTIFPCDSVLLSGDCIVNESMLTGESVPVSKVPANDETIETLVYDAIKPSISTLLAKSYLFNGTKIIRVRHSPGEPAIALVVRTGFSTTKGSLLRSMLFPKPVGFKFYEDSFKYIGFMSLIAMFGFIFSTINFIKLGLSYRIIILRALDIITIVVPPALPATLTIGTNFAITRLRKYQIYCIQPTRVNIGGKLDVLCFDKTGTLTEDGLDVLGVHAAGKEFNELLTDMNKINSNYNLLLKALVSCHSLRIVDNELIGDPLDFKMFEFTNWEYEEDFKNFTSTNEERFDQTQAPENFGISPSVVYPKTNKTQLLGIIKSFEFVSHLRRMSVITKSAVDNQFHVLSKGAPEVIKDICKPETFPENYEELLYHYTHSGYRVIAMAGKKLKRNTWLYSQKVTREEAESNLEFLGFIVFENKLKVSTKSVISELSNANLRTVMCTGDNILTAISVGKECGIVKEEYIFIPSLNEDNNTISWNEINDDEAKLDCDTLELYGEQKSYSLAISGDIFRYILKDDSFHDDFINKILLKSNIFARMSPDEKHELVEQFQDLDYTVGFCGDGANDCGALKAADVGISLSEAEASVAAPFTSRLFEISCVLDVIREGRASLVTSFSCFQYMSLYSAIQFITVSILYKRGSNLGDFQFLWIDLFLILPIAIFMSWSNSFKKIIAKRPSANLVSPKLLIPLILNIAIMLIFQIVIWLLVQKENWYIKPVPGGDDAVQSSDNTVLFFYSNFQYILSSVLLTQGPPYREPIIKNHAYIINVVVATLLCIGLMNVNVKSFIGRLFQLTKISRNFKFLIIIWAIVNYFCNDYIPGLFKNMFKKRQSNKRYKRILKSWKGGYEV